MSILHALAKRVHASHPRVDGIAHRRLLLGGKGAIKREPRRTSLLSLRDVLLLHLIGKCGKRRKIRIGLGKLGLSCRFELLEIGADGVVYGLALRDRGVELLLLRSIEIELRLNPLQHREGVVHAVSGCLSPGLQRDTGKSGREDEGVEFAFHRSNLSFRYR